MTKRLNGHGVVRKGLSAIALGLVVFGLGQTTVFGQTFNAEAPDPGEIVTAESGETSISVERVGSCKNTKDWKASCDNCGVVSEGKVTAGSSGACLM